MASYCKTFLFLVFVCDDQYFKFIFVDDAVFRRKITESANSDERNRPSENKRGRWDQPDAQKINSDEQWERIVERARNLRRFVPTIDIIILR